MKATDYLAQNKDNIRHYNEVNQVIDELKPHRTDFGKIWLYCTENLLNDKKYNDALLNDAKFEVEQNKWVYSKGFEWEKCAEIRSELRNITKKDETYTVLYHFLMSEYTHLDEKLSYTVADYEKFAQQAERAITLLAETADTIVPEPEYFDLPDNLLNKLQKQELIENTNDRPLKWLRKKVLLAYFVEIVNEKLDLKQGEKRQIKPFETLFNVSGLTSAINDYKKIGTLPVGHREIDRLF